MAITSSDTRGYLKVKEAAKYAGVSQRTFREWLKGGLRHIRLPSGTILVPYSWIDEYLLRFEARKDQIEVIINEIMREF